MEKNTNKWVTEIGGVVHFRARDFEKWDQNFSWELVLKFECAEIIKEEVFKYTDGQVSGKLLLLVIKETGEQLIIESETRGNRNQIWLVNPGNDIEVKWKEIIESHKKVKDYTYLLHN